MTIQRQNIVRGAGIVKIGSTAFYAAGDISAEPDKKTFYIPNSRFGIVDERLDDVITPIRFTPAGEWENLSTLFPHQNPTIGADIFGATDVNILVHSAAGVLQTWQAGAITRMPSIFLAANKPLFGPMEITALRKDDTAASTASSLVAITSTSLSDTSFANSAVITQPYSAAWASPFTSIPTESGWEIIPEMKVKFQQTDESGTIAAYLEEVGVMAKCTPLGFTESQIMTALNIQGTASSVRGSSLRTLSNDLVISATGVSVTIKNAQMKAAGFRWGTTTLRAGEIGFVGIRTESAGAFGALFVLA